MGAWTELCSLLPPTTLLVPSKRPWRGSSPESATGERAATIDGSMMARSWTGSSQESASGGRAATFGGSMMVRSWTGRSRESATGGRVATIGGSMAGSATESATGGRIATFWRQCDGEIVDWQFAGVCNRRKDCNVWRQRDGEVIDWLIAGVYNRRKGRNVWRQHDGEIIHGRESEGWIYPSWGSFKRMRNPAEEVGGFVGGIPIAWRLEAERGRGATRRWRHEAERRMKVKDTQTRRWRGRGRVQQGLSTTQPGPAKTRGRQGERVIEGGFWRAAQARALFCYFVLITLGHRGVHVLANMTEKLAFFSGLRLRAQAFAPKSRESRWQ
jgi:hypothetical protein